MSRHDADRLADITTAIEAIRSHLTQGDLYNGLVDDAVRVRLIEIGEAVKSISPDLLATAPEVSWSAIARMRDQDPFAAGRARAARDDADRCRTLRDLRRL